MSSVAMSDSEFCAFQASFYYVQAGSKILDCAFCAIVDDAPLYVVDCDAFTAVHAYDCQDTVVYGKTECRVIAGLDPVNAVEIYLFDIAEIAPRRSIFIIRQCAFGDV